MNVAFGLGCCRGLQIYIGALRLQDADNASIEIQEVVRFLAAIQQSLDHGNGIVLVGKVVPIANMPTNLGQLRIDLNALAPRVSKWHDTFRLENQSSHPFYLS